MATFDAAGLVLTLIAILAVLVGVIAGGVVLGLRISRRGRG